MKVAHYIADYNPADRERGEPCLEIIGGHGPPSMLVLMVKLVVPELLYEIEVMDVMTDEEVTLVTDEMEVVSWMPLRLF
jgi:hypothetical protein